MSDRAGRARNLHLHIAKRHAAAILATTAALLLIRAEPAAADALKDRQPGGVGESLKSLESLFHRSIILR